MNLRLSGDLPDERAPRPLAAPRASRQATAIRWGALVVGFVVGSVLVMQQSSAVFSATTVNTGNSASAGTIVLADNDSGSALFASVTNLVPGTTLDRCITVNYTGTLDPVPIELYMSTAPTGTLGPYLNLQVDIGNASGDAYSSCTSFASTSTLYNNTLANFSTTYTNWATGLATWDPPASTSRTFRFRISVQDNDAAAGRNATNFAFTWEARSA